MGNEGPTEQVEQLTEDDLNAMTIARIRALAAERGYTITATLKAEIIAEFLEQQAAGSGTQDDVAP